MDEADRAQIEIEREQSRLLESARRVHRVYSNRCLDCGDSIPEQRQQYGLCVACAEDRERLERHAGMTTERIRVIAEYELEYETPEGREDAIASALDGAIDSRGVGMYGCYRATRGVLTLAGSTAIQAEESSKQ